MKRNLLFFCLLILSLSFSPVFGQLIISDNYSNSKKLVTIPAVKDSSSGENFCICKIVSLSSDNNLQRTDAIFAGSTPENSLTKKELIRNINYELQQALVFFDSYKLIQQYASPVDCNTLYKYLKEQHTEINRFTVLLPSYVSR